MLRLLFVVAFTTPFFGCNDGGQTSTTNPPPSNGSAAADASAATDAAGAADGSSGSVAAPAEKEVTLKVLGYQQIQKLIASHRGKVVVVDCWSTSCQPCIREFPNLVELHEKYSPEKLACISLSFDYEGIGELAEVKDMVLGFLKKQGATFDNVLSSVESDELYKKMDLTAVPAVYVYRANGELAKRFDIESEGGEFTYEDIGQLVAELIAGL